MKPLEPTRTIYPRLPDIMDEETLSLVTVLASRERRFVLEGKKPRIRYLSALYLKAMSYMGHSRFKPGELPRLFRLRVARELELSRDFADIQKIHAVEKSRIVTKVRRLLGLQRYDHNARMEAIAWLKQEITSNESDLLMVVNEVIIWFRDHAIELPVFQVAVAIAEKALFGSDQDLQNRIASAFDSDQISRLDTLLIKKDGRSPLDRFKAAPRKPSSINLQAELDRLRELSGVLDNLPQP